MAVIPDSHADLVGAPHFAHLATINADGSPQSTPIWVQRDGDDVLFTTDAGYRKARNIARDARVSLSIHDERNPYRYIELRGRAETEPRDDYAFLDGLSNQYLGRDYPYKTDDAQGILVRVRLDHVVTMG